MKNFPSATIRKCFLSLILEKFAVKSTSENHFTLVQKNSDSLLFSHIPIDQRQPRDVRFGIVIEQTNLKCKAAVVICGDI